MTLPEVKAKCQSCLDRGLEPNDSVGLWQGQPICDACLGPLMDNANAVNTGAATSKDNLDERIKQTLPLLDKLEELMDNWPLTAEETLRCHEDFYNHRPPAIINLTLKQIEEINSRRKGILFAARYKDEQWSVAISNLKKEKRAEANLVGLVASKKEVSKRVPSDAVTREKNAKIAASIGLSLEQYEETLSQAKLARFELIVGAKEESKNVPFVKTTATGEILEDLKAKVKARQQGTDAKAKINPITGKPYA